MNKKRRNFITLWLIGMLILQPILSSVAMAGMTHSVDQDSSSQGHMPDSMANSIAMSPSMGMVMDENTCLSMTLCSMAEFNVGFLPTISPMRNLSITLNNSEEIIWFGIALPTEIRPPRNLSR